MNCFIIIHDSLRSELSQHLSEERMLTDGKSNYIGSHVGRESLSKIADSNLVGRPLIDEIEEKYGSLVSVNFLTDLPAEEKEYVHPDDILEESGMEEVALKTSSYAR